MSKRFFLNMAVFTGLFSLVMFLFSQIDLTISGWFYHPPQGFLLEYYYERLYLDILRNFLVYFTYGFIAIITVMLIIGLYFKSMKMPLSPKNCVFLLICFGLAPGILVNDILKNHWGRPRPIQVQQFGGDKIFIPAWVKSTECEKNCSFTSGETANVFCYLALLFIIPRKKWIGAVILSMGVLIMFERMAQGAHFFSDVLLSGLLDYLAIWLIYQIMQKFLERKDVRNFRTLIHYKNQP
jgi:lipid A 4'-phosphatase